MREQDSTDPEWLSELQQREEWPSDLDGDRLGFRLLENFRSPDPKLRDGLSYGLLARLVEDNRLSPSGVRTLLYKALDDDHLFLHIGSQEDDSVFLRSFSVLVIPLVLETPASRKALAPEDVAYAKTAVLRYAREEQDWRGYVTGKGWAHAVAHTADALGSLGCDAAVNRDGRREILDGLHHLAMLPYPLGFLEDDRLAYAVFQMLQSGRLKEPEFFQWLESFHRVEDRVEGPDDGAQTLSGANAMHVLRSLYVRLLHQDTAHPWLGPVLRAADRFDVFLPYSPPA